MCAVALAAVVAAGLQLGRGAVVVEALRCSTCLRVVGKGSQCRVLEGPA